MKSKELTWVVKSSLDRNKTKGIEITVKETMITVKETMVGLHQLLSFYFALSGGTVTRAPKIGLGDTCEDMTLFLHGKMLDSVPSALSIGLLYYSSFGQKVMHMAKWIAIGIFT